MSRIRHGCFQSSFAIVSDGLQHTFQSSLRIDVKIQAMVLSKRKGSVRTACAKTTMKVHEAISAPSKSHFLKSHFQCYYAIDAAKVQRGQKANAGTSLQRAQQHRATWCLLAEKMLGPIVLRGHASPSFRSFIKSSTKFSKQTRMKQHLYSRPPATKRKTHCSHSPGHTCKEHGSTGGYWI